MAKYDYDLFVIGAGSGGVSASRRAAVFGAKAIICEEYRVGGTCVIRGCVPKKLFTYAAHYAEDFEDAVGFGWQEAHPGFDWPTLIANKDAEIDRLNGIYIKMLNNAGVDLIEDRGVLIDPHTVEVGGKTVTAETILVATGARPFQPDFPGVEHTITSNEAFHLEELPQRAVVVGGGYIAVEFAGIFNGLGSQVTQLYRGEQILRGFDDDVRGMLAEEIGKKGIDLRVESQVERIEKSDGQLEVTISGGETISADIVMYATGRNPNTDGVGLTEAGVELDEKGAIKVDQYSKTSVANIYAVGDVTNRMNLTPVAINEGRAFAETLYANQPRSVDYANIPHAVFSNPSVGVSGLSEARARQQYDAVDIYKSRFRPMKHTLTGRDEQTLMKLIVDVATDRVVGVHMVGPDAAEIVQGMGIALTCGATKAQFDATIGIHPSAAEEFVTMREKVADIEAVAVE
jgi:glutathione reductase (NADPH)